MSTVIKIPLKNLLPIWKKCYIDNPSERVKLDKLDTLVTKRMSVNSSVGNQFIQLTQSELNYLKELYERIF